PISDFFTSAPVSTPPTGCFVTSTVTSCVSCLPLPLALRRYVVVEDGVTSYEPVALVERITPFGSCTVTLALEVDHARCDVCPPRTETGVAVNELMTGSAASAPTLRDVLWAPVDASPVVSLPLSTRTVSTIITRGPRTDWPSQPR